MSSPVDKTISHSKIHDLPRRGGTKTVREKPECAPASRPEAVASAFVLVEEFRPW